MAAPNQFIELDDVGGAAADSGGSFSHEIGSLPRGLGASSTIPSNFFSLSSHQEPLDVDVVVGAFVVAAKKSNFLLSCSESSAHHSFFGLVDVVVVVIFIKDGLAGLGCVGSDGKFSISNLDLVGALQELMDGTVGASPERLGKSCSWRGFSSLGGSEGASGSRCFELKSYSTLIVLTFLIWLRGSFRFDRCSSTYINVTSC